ncbi:hypothetical protein CISG_02929 [Coccidioides immitis RMSCC 3703]|uniref:Uncharacterized protein n=1 Tax=Coccidioides immitis RMSCC 3703 TaxID=454286 RepID=A0A0J8QIJ8_COCIT|nr:hypothetical protein CISG_02929 [Coccidioides immitis RMSCC 3703]
MGKAARSTSARGRAPDLSGPDNNDGNDFRMSSVLQTSTDLAPTRANQAREPTPPSKGREGPRKFEFVLVTDSESRRQVRRYAMRQYVHQRRLDGIARLESNKARVRGWTTTGAGSDGISSPAIKQEDHESSCDSKNISNSESSGSSIDFGELDALALFAPRTDEEIREREPFRGLPGLDPQAGPSSGVIDPFDSYPLALRKGDHNLIPHSLEVITRYPLMMYKMGHAHQLNPIRAIFHRVAIHDPVPFQAMLAVASKHMAGVHGQTDTVLSLTHKMRALRLLNERLKNDPWGKHEGTIYTAASMAVIEKWSKADSVESLHIRGLIQLLKRRGGMRGMRIAGPTSQFMEKILYWVDFSCAPSAIVGTSLPWTGNTPDIAPTLPFMVPRLCLDTSALSDDQEITSILQSCEDFFSFFHSLNKLQQFLLGPSSLSKIGDLEQDSLPKNRAPFDSLSPLYNILSSLPDYDHGIRDIRYIDEHCCMACLLYLNLALYDYYLTSRNFNDYLAWINFEVRKLNPNGGASIASILWIFLDNGGFPGGEISDHGERNWLVSRMLRVAKRYKRTGPRDMWDCLRSTLLGFLTIHQECGIGDDSVGPVELSARRRWRHNKPMIILEEARLREMMLDQLRTSLPTP